MTYLLFLALFLVLPLGVAIAVAVYRSRRGQPITALGAGALLAHIALAVVYTTPWDNYLVATGVWSYALGRVLGFTLGWVPLEEYLFFVLQTLLTGLIVLLLARRWPANETARAAGSLNRVSAGALAVVWALAVLTLAIGWRPATYLGLELAWALPPIGIQLAIGADVLWRRRRSVLLALLPITLYLSAADWLAIRSGVWRIDPAQSLNLFLAGLPIEEALFFLLTNSLLVFGVTLALAPRETLKVSRTFRVHWRWRRARP